MVQEIAVVTAEELALVTTDKGFGIELSLPEEMETRVLRELTRVGVAATEASSFFRLTRGVIYVGIAGAGIGLLWWLGRR